MSLINIVGIAKILIVSIIVVAPAAMNVLSTHAQGRSFQNGLHYYAIENLETGEIVRRGVGSGDGIAFAMPDLITPFPIDHIFKRLAAKISSEVFAE